MIRLDDGDAIADVTVVKKDDTIDETIDIMPVEPENPTEGITEPFEEE